jgi:hypothetical protein
MRELTVQMRNKERLKLLADVQGSQIRKKAGCGKLQYTPYGECIDCPESLDCHTCMLVKELTLLYMLL